MGIAVNWAAVPNSTGYVLYRNVGSPVNLSALPTDKVEVASDVTSYTYPTGVNNTLYYIVVGSKKADGSVTYGDQIPIGYYPDTGPGPSVLLRGDWAFGYFGEVSSSELLVGNEIFQLLLTAVGAANVLPPTNAPTIATYHKCVIAGRIVFIPDNTYSASTITPASLVTNKLIVVDGDYPNKGITGFKNGYEYVIRCPHANLTGVSTPALANYDGIYTTELGMMFSLFGNTAGQLPVPVAGVTSYAKYRLGDLAPGTNVNVHWSTTLGASGAQYVYASLSTNTLNYTVGASARPVLVLELLF
ncbi:hypothetical protein pEaSNUABM37_00130 [Erwinia phage pEa_SNUABM_37]|nr:hypothetical protein pEaSNUABM37_00130 [Erwinia phage pEa_SNUABM_37]QXO10600.1 hypothetical protein pEaSNUABM48_00130 [Erwinia phage pEa_SNUABM_48]